MARIFIWFDLPPGSRQNKVNAALLLLLQLSNHRQISVLAGLLPWTGRPWIAVSSILSRRLRDMRGSHAERKQDGSLESNESEDAEEGTSCMYWIFHKTSAFGNRLASV